LKMKTRCVKANFALYAYTDKFIQLPEQQSFHWYFQYKHSKLQQQASEYKYKKVKKMQKIKKNPP